VRQRVTFYVTEHQLGYLQREATRRRQSLSSYIAGCVLDYHQQPTSTGDHTPTPPFDVLLRESEQRIAAQLTRANRSECGRIANQLTTITAMLDRYVLSALVHTPEVSPDLRGRAIESAERRYANWRDAVREVLENIEAPISHTQNGDASGAAEEEV
jgi:hypothetical protein